MKQQYITREEFNSYKFAIILICIYAFIAPIAFHYLGGVSKELDNKQDKLPTPNIECHNVTKLANNCVEFGFGISIKDNYACYEDKYCCEIIKKQVCEKVQHD